MIYLPIKEASKYIKRETGIKLPIRTIADFAYCDDIDVYVSGAYLENEGFHKMKVSYEGLIDHICTIANERYPEIEKPFDEKYEIEQWIATDTIDVLYRCLLTRYTAITAPYCRLTLNGKAIHNNHFCVSGVINNDMARQVRGGSLS